jgi:ATP-binding protein involved in chromosome partitioning
MWIKNDERAMSGRTKAISEKEIRNVIGQIKHAAIDCSLVDLGIVKDVIIEKNRATVTLAFPFANIPIKEYLVMSIKTPLEKLGVEIEIKTTVMNEKESQRFLEMEAKYWKGKTE